MKKTTQRNAFYAQSGGVTAVINASAAGVIETARAHKDKIGAVYAGRNGILGALTEDLIDTSRESAKNIAALKHTPAGAFGSCRYKLKGIDESRAQYERLIDVFRAHDIGYFFYNGGNDSADTCLKVSQIADKLGYPLQAVHVPKTVDNDLALTDNCPGFGSVAKYVATSMREAAFDVASMSKTSTQIFVMEVMGRHAGWITAAVGLADDKETPIPLLLLFPEIAFDEEKFLAAVRKKVDAFGYCCIGVSEGLRDASGKLMSEVGTRDAFGHAQLGGIGPQIAQLTKAKLGYKYHWAVADYLQRAARHLASKTDLEQSYAVGRAAVQLALAGHNAVMPAIVRTSEKPYRWKIEPMPLSKIANHEKMLPKNFITKDGYGITDKARAYLTPLIRGEAPPPFKDGVPQYVRLKNLAVPKKLKTDFVP
ncbi:MAG: 6-phosphofructokinase [Proteobacteria bacterium]|nr:6-phosphofructokinase [Pseudomonadota bacterium]MCL2308446.1 6-phosphofructokinase [Pseudomonadota bacterium]